MTDAPQPNVLTEAPVHASRTRERVALVIFLVLIAFGGILLSAYFLTGKTWSIAATIMDDAAGSMDDYTVVVFNGVIDPKGAKEADGKDAPVRENEITLLDVINSSTDDKVNDALGGRILSMYELAGKQQASTDDKVYASDVRDIYELKGAGGITLNIADIERYADPEVLNAGNRKYGVFSIGSYTSRAKLKSTIDELRRDGADSVICIAPRQSLLATFDGIDAVVLTESVDSMARKTDTGGTLVAESPFQGEAGVITFSSNNVPSYKIIGEL